MEDELRKLLLAIAEVDDIPPEQRLDAMRELVRVESGGTNTAVFGPQTLAWFTRSGLTLGAAPAAAPTSAAHPPVPAHFEVVRAIDVGGMGEVWEVRDRDTGAPRALKTIRAERGADPLLRALFEREVKTTDNLQHPGIPPIADHGVLGDGRPYYAMKIYEGRTLRTVLLEQAPRPRGYATVRATVEHLLRVCDAVGFAHGRGVIHRDLKPENVYLGEFEVIVLDWGIAQRLLRSAEGGFLETSGDGAGTAGYIAPEQAKGGRVGPAADVWALGVMLHEARNAGEPPAEGDGPEVRALDPIVAAALQEDPAARPADASRFGAELRRWLDASERRQRAMELVHQADEEARSAERLRARAAEARQEAAALAAGLQPWHSAEEKRLAWMAEDEAVALERRAGRHLVERERLLNATFTHAPELPEAHQRLAAIHRAHHERAETDRDLAAAERSEVLLRVHDRGEHAAYLRAEGALTVVSTPRGARATLYRYALRNRRLVPEFVRELGPTPIVEATVPCGSWLVRLSHPGHVTVDHPVTVGRLEHVDGVAPGEAAPRPIRLPRLGEVGEDDCVITPGWTFTGWDREAPSAPPDGRTWVEGFVVKRFPTTNREYLGFLNGLLGEGREADALRWAPREKGSATEPNGRMLYGLGPDGFFLTPDAEGTLWEPEWPAMMIDWESAAAYAAWKAAREDVPWRLPGEDEWERAARGADKRQFPWGDFFDSSWALTRASRPEGEKVLPDVVQAFPGDESPFGVRALAGGIREWCGNVWGSDTPNLRTFPTLRGGAWLGGPMMSRIGTRTFNHASDRSVIIGFRVLRETPRG